MQQFTSVERNILHKPAVTFAIRQAMRAQKPESLAARRNRVKKELRSVGVTRYGLMYAEAKELPLIIHENEHIQGAVYGQGDDGFAFLAATDLRVLFVDKKPMFTKSVEISYDLVGGVSYGHVGWFATVTLHTRIGDYKLKTINFPCAQRFIEFIELRCLEHKMHETNNQNSVWKI